MPSLKKTIAKERQALMELMDEGDYAIPSRKLNQNLVIASWNIQQFSNRHQDRAIQYMADICERFDLIALQEIKTDLRGLSRLQRKIPGNYKILVSDPTGNSERLAFLYDKRSVISTGLVAEIVQNVSAKKDMKSVQFHRTPYCASFRAGRFDFVIATAHIFFGKGEQKKHRTAEIQRLVDFIAQRAKTTPNKVFDRDLMVSGDFNIEEAGDQFSKALKSQKFKMPLNMDSLGTNFAQSKTFDKIAWVNRKSFKHTGKCNVVPFGKVLYQDQTPKGGRKQISDHLPLWAEFEINKLSQELSQIINKK